MKSKGVSHPPPSLPSPHSWKRLRLLTSPLLNQLPHIDPLLFPPTLTHFLLLVKRLSYRFHKVPPLTPLPSPHSLILTQTQTNCLFQDTPHLPFPRQISLILHHPRLVLFKPIFQTLPSYKLFNLYKHLLSPSTPMSCTPPHRSLRGPETRRGCPMIQ